MRKCEMVLFHLLISIHPFFSKVEIKLFGVSFCCPRPFARATLSTLQLVIDTIAGG